MHKTDSLYQQRNSIFVNLLEILIDNEIEIGISLKRSDGWVDGQISSNNR